MTSPIETNTNLLLHGKIDCTKPNGTNVCYIGSTLTDCMLYIILWQALMYFGNR